MSAQGPNTDLIFVAITQKEGKAKLEKVLNENLYRNPIFRNELFLMRESASLPGAITLDRLKYDHLINDYVHSSVRYAYVQNLQDGFGAGIFDLFTDNDTPEYNWCIIPNDERQLLIDNQNYIFINKEQLCSDKNKEQFFESLIQTMQNIGINFDNIVRPTRQERTRDQHYITFGEYFSFKLHKNTQVPKTMLEQAEVALEKMESKGFPICPITFDEISDVGYITPQGQMYSSAILSWIDEHHTDPLTRETLTREQLLLTKASLKFEEAKQKLKEILSQFKGESSESHNSCGSSMRM